MAARKLHHQRQRTLATTRAEYRAAKKAARLASEAVERVLTSIESRQGFLPFDSGAPTESGKQTTTAGR